MRRTTSVLFLALALMTIMLVGCGSTSSATSTAESASETNAAESTSEAAAAEPTIESQTINLTSVANARELGGYVGDGGRTVRRGVLLRTAAPSEISDEDKARLVDDLKLATVIDFRMTSEVEKAPDPEIEGVSNVNLRIIDETKLADIAERMAKYVEEGGDPNDKSAQLKIAIESGFISDQMYVDFLSTDTGKAGYKDFFEQLEALPEGSSLLFHCTQGKDRTGIAAMLILSVLGVDEQTIMQDYLLTNEFNADAIAQERKMLEDKGIEGDMAELYLLAMDGVNEKVMQNALDWLKENYGSPTDYVKQELGVTDAQIEALRDKFLE